MIVNNYYISDKESGWKQLIEGEILPNISGNVAQRISSEISPNKTAMEHSNRQSKTNTEEKGLNINQEVKATAKAMKSTNIIEEPKRYNSEEAEVQNMSPPQHTTLITKPL